MRPLTRKLLRDLRASRATLASILLVIVVGVATFVGMASMYVNLLREQEAYYRDCRMADFWVDLEKAPVSEAERVGEIPGVSEVRTRISTGALVDLEGVDAPISARVLSLPERPAGAINGVALRRGSLFSGSRVAEAVIDDAFARARGLRPGDRLRLITGGQALDLLIVGTAISSEFAYLLNPGGLIPDPERYGVVWLERTYAEETLDYDGACNQVVGMLARGANESATLERIERAMADYGVITVTPRRLQASHQILSDELAQLQATAVALPGVFLAVAALVLNILMSRVAEQQRVVIGTLKALGFSSGRMLRHFLAYSLLVGLVGGGIGLGVGWFMAEGFLVLYRAYFEFPSLENRFTPWVYAGGLGLSLAFALLGGARGVRSVLRRSPAEAMRPKPPAVGGAILLERARWAWSRLGFRGRMAARSVSRHKWRTGAGLFASAMGASLMFTTFYFLDSMDYLVRHQFDKVLRSDFDLALEDERDSGVALAARRLPGVLDAEPTLTVPCDFERGHRRKRSAVIGIEPDARLTVPSDRAGRPVRVPGAGLLMSRRLAEDLGVEAGQSLTVVPIFGRTDPREATVARIVDSYLGAATYADRRWLNRLIGERDAVSAVQLSASPVEGRRRDLTRALQGVPAVQAVVDNGRTREKLQTTLLDALRYSVSTLIGVAAVMYFGSILTSSLIAVSERRREIATLHAMGFSLADVGGVLLRESLLVNMAGSLAGLPLGLWLSRALIEAHSRESYRLPTVASPWSYLLTILLAALFTLAAHALVQRAIRRLDWRDAIKLRE